MKNKRNIRKTINFIVVTAFLFNMSLTQGIVLSPTQAETPTTLAICDHNGDNVRNLSDVAIFATCKDTFDANGDGIHNLSDVGIYASMNQDSDFCNNTFECVATPVVEEVVEEEVEEVPTLAICDHNGDNVRNLSDVAIFATCKDTFDANGDGIHNLSDVGIYASMNQDSDFCNNTFECVATPVVEEVVEEEVEEVPTLAICDHNGDSVRNLSDVAIFATCKDTFDANGDGIHNLTDISLYASMNHDSDFCNNTFECVATPVVEEEIVEEVIVEEIIEEKVVEEQTYCSAIMTINPSRRLHASQKSLSNFFSKYSR